MHIQKILVHQICIYIVKNRGGEGKQIGKKQKTINCHEIKVN